ncbi:MAG: hypothetical protein EOP23_04025 [Hyphomicrobiales bacterium]|nr:MAG: hypothetical protein EOP23_04025 [Hyphomicrobiales bacterium]
MRRMLQRRAQRRLPEPARQLFADPCRGLVVPLHIGLVGVAGVLLGIGVNRHFGGRPLARVALDRFHALLLFRAELVALTVPHGCLLGWPPDGERVSGHSCSAAEPGFCLQRRRNQFAATAVWLSGFAYLQETLMDSIIYLVGLVVVIMAILSFIGLR